MAAVLKERLLERHKEVRKAFNKMRDSQKYRYLYILKTIAKRYHYSERRVEEIMAMDDNDPYYINTNHDPNQQQLF